MAFRDRKGWDAKVEGRVVGRPPSKPGLIKTAGTSLDVYLDQLPPHQPEAQPILAPPPEPVVPLETVVAEVLPAAPPAKPVRYHSKPNKLSPGLHVLRIGGELTDAALKRIVDFITAELNAQQY